MSTSAPLVPRSMPPHAVSSARRVSPYPKLWRYSRTTACDTSAGSGTLHGMTCGSIGSLGRYCLGLVCMQLILGRHGLRRPMHSGHYSCSIRLI